MSITPPVARTRMLIRRSASDVYRAFIDPAETSRFWFSRSSAALTPGSRVTWFWDMYGFAADVKVVALEENRRIVIEWPTRVEWTLDPRGETATFVTIVASGFTGTDDEQVSRALDSMGGFTFLLAACKAWLEHGIELNLVLDHDPDHHVTRKE